MNRTQIAAIYDEFPEFQRDMPREEFIRKALTCQDPTANGKILAQMVHGKQQHRQGQVQKAQIDAALRDKR